MKIRFTLPFLILFACIHFVQAQNKSINIWPKLAPGSEKVENNEQWTGTKSVTNVYQPNLTDYTLKNKDKLSTCVIIFPGGGYNQVVMEKEGYKLARWFNENGISAFVLKYRLNREEALQDAQRAVRFVRKNAEEFGIDPNKLGVMGFSAGAHLAGNLVENNQKFEVYDALDSVSLMPDFWIPVYGLFGDVEFVDGKRINKEYQAHSEIPPAFIVHAGNDPKVPVLQSVNLYSKLKANNIPAELHIYEFGEHGFALETNRGAEVTSTVNSWSGRLLEWLKIKGFL